MKHLQTYRFIADIARQGSIRKTAEYLHITPSALTRKIQDFEEELGTPIFERLPQGMRLNAAGELVLRHIQSQVADFDRLRIQIDDLSGIRRGHVSIACSQAFVYSVIPDVIAAYRTQFPRVTFSALVRDHHSGLEALTNFEADLALLLDPPHAAEMRELMVTTQPLCAVMSATHPLAKYEHLRLRDCCAYPIAMPTQTLAIRGVVDAALYRRHLKADIAIESGSLEVLRAFVLREHAITFQISSGVPSEDKRICVKPIQGNDANPVRIVLWQLKGRSLSIAAAKFADQLTHHLS